ncbi:MAG: DNA translocase FtsK [Spirochaetes bacterium]|nr:DNA translocase FtsK [Spirochaetota bacterium]
MSKIIYEHNNNRTEIPVIPRDNAKIRQFQLINEDESKEEYQEIKLINNQNEILNDRNNEIYFKTLKEEWPKTWKSSENNNIINDAGNEQFFDDLDETDFESFNQLNKKKNNFNNYQNEDLSQFQDYELPESDILENYNNLDKNSFIAEHKESARTLEETLKEFDIDAKVTEIINGPVVTLYKLIPAPGIKLQKIESLSNNLALRLAAKSIRIIAPIPGEKVVGIEIPNRVRQLVKFKEIVKNEDFTETEFHIPIGLGKDIHGNIIVIDLYKMPHLLIAGATGSGKSVCVNSIIASILFSKSPDDIRLLLIDPKIVELKPYNNIPHLLTPVIYEPKKAIQALKYLMYEMDRRYILLDEVGARDIVEYQKRKIKSKNQNLEDLKFIVAVVDEFADLMNTSGKEAEIIFARLAAKARAVGIHLILATQRPSTDVITGLIKANIPARIAFQVISLMNSRIILDQKGAENLLGQGDMLYISPTQPFPIRIQGAFLSKEEVDLITDHWKSISTPNYINIDDFIKEENEDDDLYYNENDEPLFEEALKIIYQTHKASASYLQRRLSIGYNRAARIIEEMEKRGILGPQNGSKPREIMKSSPDMY